MKRNNYNIFTGGTKVSKHTTNGQPLWANRSALQSSGDMEPQQVDRPPPAPDVFQEREGAGGMRVGRDYQARIPTPIPKPEQNRQADADKALLVWSPSDRMTEAQLDNYLDVAKTKYHYTWEQALGLLFWHRYDVGRALQDLGNFTPHPEDWTIEDKVLFEQAFQFHGKAFDRIRQMLPEKSMSSLIRYYYKWKKCRSRNSVMDRQAKRFNHGREDGDEITPGLPLSNSFPTPAHHPGGLSQVKDVFSNGHQRHGCSDSDDDILVIENC
jgi:hypothetical protein